MRWSETFLKVLKNVHTSFEGRLKAYADQPHIWYLDWALRYFPIVRRLFCDIIENSTILEIGSNEFGLRLFLPWRIIGIDLTFDQQRVLREQLSRIIASVIALPIFTASTDCVVCVDTFEHLSIKDRPQALFEILRVLKVGGKAFIAFPCGRDAEQFERRLWKSMKHDGIRIGWLEEHMANAFPTVAEFLEALDKTSARLRSEFRVRQYKTNSLMFQRVYIPLLLNANDTGLNLYFRVLLKAFLPLLSRLNFGNCYRQMFVLEKCSTAA